MEHEIHTDATYDAVDYNKMLKKLKPGRLIIPFLGCNLEHPFVNSRGIHDEMR